MSSEALAKYTQRYYHYYVIKLSECNLNLPQREKLRGKKWVIKTSVTTKNKGDSFRYKPGGTQHSSVPLRAVGLAPAGHRVADARAGARVHVLHDDEGMLLQRGHGQVAVVRHLLQEAAVPRPDRVADLEDPSSVRAHLQHQEQDIVVMRRN